MPATALTPAKALKNLLNRLAEKYGQAVPVDGEQVDEVELRALIDQSLAELDD